MVAPVKTAWSGKQVEGWMIFTGVKGLVLKGKAVFDARGSSWWPTQTCYDDPAHVPNFNQHFLPSLIYIYI